MRWTFGLGVSLFAAMLVTHKASADDWAISHISEVRGGVASTASDHPSPSGDVQILFSPLPPVAAVYDANWAWLFAPRPLIGAAVSLSGKTNEAYAGLAWNIPVIGRYFVEVSAGGLVHDQELNRAYDDRTSPLTTRFLFRESIAQNPNITEAHYNLGLVLDRLQRHAEAIESYQRAVQCQPSFAAAHAELGRTCYLLGRLAEAESHLRHALALGADPGETNHMLALVLAGQGRAAEALDGFAQALLYNPNLAAAHLNYGLLLATVGRPAEARVELTRALALDPKLPMAREALEKLTATGAKP